MVAVLFVCVANICRSPALQATLKHLSVQKKQDIQVDSCGIGWVHLGQAPSPKMFEAAKKRDIIIDHRAEEFQDAYFEAYDYIFAVDDDIVEQLKARSPEHASKIHLASNFSKKFKKQPIPDPYYLTKQGFEEVMDIITDSCEGILEHLTKKGSK